MNERNGDVDERDRLRNVFSELHGHEPLAPEYRALRLRPLAIAPWVRARRIAAAWALALAVAAGALFLALRTPTAPAEDETLLLAASLGAWEAPTDFLLSTPGAEFLESAPLLGTGTETLSGDRTDLLQNDATGMDDSNGMEELE